MNPKTLIPRVRWSKEEMESFKSLYQKAHWILIPFLAIATAVQLPVLIVAGLTYQFLKKVQGEKQNKR